MEVEGAVDVHAERRRLVALAHRLLGTTAEAEDAVQEAYVRWYRMTDAERAAVVNPPGWLTTVVSRVCLDVLGSARHRRERCVGQWLPEPVRAQHLAGGAAEAADPFERVGLAESVSTAVLVVMETVTPAERVAFVLHDVFAVPFGEIAAIVGRSPAAVRQLASSARRRVRERGAAGVDRAAHDEVVRAFAHAAGTGDLVALSALLDPSVTLVSDGGGVVSAARRPVLGVSNVARFVLGVAGEDPSLRLEPTVTGDGLAFVLVAGDRVRAVVDFGVVDGRVRDVWIQMNPAKLRGWGVGT